MWGCRVATAEALAAPDPAGGAEVLHDLPAEHWTVLLRAVRRATEQLDRSMLPPVFRPFAGWRPERLIAGRPRRAVAVAMAEDPRLREAVGKALDVPGLYGDAEATDPGRLEASYGLDAAVAGLAARGRWDDLAVLAARSAQRAALHGRAAAEAAQRHEAEAELDARRKLAGELRLARADRDAHRRRADAAEQRERDAASERAELVGRLADLEARNRELTAALKGLHRRSDREAARLRRRLAEAQERIRVDDRRIEELAGQLTALANGLRAALGRQERDGGDADPARRDGGRERPAAPTLPRQVPAALKGRPCRLPSGVAEDDPLGVEALLLVPSIAVILDGYNVTKDAAGRPTNSLPEQRGWLLSLAAAMSARFNRRLDVVFDGTEERPPALRAPRGVRVSFSAGEQTADTRIVAMVADLPPDQPVLVVSSDREVREDCQGLGANVASARSFLRLASP